MTTCVEFRTFTYVADCPFRYRTFILILIHSVTRQSIIIVTWIQLVTLVHRCGRKFKKKKQWKSETLKMFSHNADFFTDSEPNISIYCWYAVVVGAV